MASARGTLCLLSTGCNTLYDSLYAFFRLADGNESLSCTSCKTFHDSSPPGKLTSLSKSKANAGNMKRL